MRGLQSGLQSGLAALVAMVAPSAGAAWQLEHELSVEAQYFLQADTLRGGASRTDDRTGGLGQSNAALALESRLTTETSHGTQITLVPFVRVDASDSERNHVDLREAHLLHVLGDWVVQAGVGKEFWGVTESQHLVDIINQTDALEGSDSDAKLGQPMLKLTREFEQGRVDAYVLPLFRAQTFLSANNRRGAPVPLSGRTRYESDNEEQHIDTALRWSGYWGAVDYGLSWFKGTARAPAFVPANAERSAFDVLYPQLTQWGVDVQYTGESVLFKLEAVRRETAQENYSAATAGVEVTQYGLRDGILDLGWLAEIHTDSRDEQGSHAGKLVFQDDLFLGARLSFNDAESSSLLVGALRDNYDGSTSVRLEGERRLKDNWKLGVEAQWYTDIAEGNIMQGLADNDFVRVTVYRYF